MLRYIDLFTYVIYNYYKNARTNQDRAFFNTKIALLGILGINVVSVIFMLDRNSNILSVNGSSNYVLYAKALAFYVLPGYAIISFLFKERRMIILEMNDSTKRKATNFVRGYIIFTILFLIFSLNAKYIFT